MSETLKAKFKRAKNNVINKIKDKGYDILLSKFDRLTSEIEVVYPENFAEKIRHGFNAETQTGTNTNLPLILTNHLSHADSFPLAPVTKKVTESLAGQLEGFIIPAANTLIGNKQSPYITRVYEGLAHTMKTIYHLEARFYMRKKDGTSFNRDALEPILRANEQGYGVAAFYEGVVEGGRTGEDGKMKGMQPVGEANLMSLVSTLDRPKRGREVLYIPVSFDGTYHAYSPDKKYPSLKEVVGLMFPSLLARRITALVHEPITTAQMRKLAAEHNIEEADYPKFVSRFISGQIASVLSPKAQGEYGREVAADYQKLIAA